MDFDKYNWFREAHFGAFIHWGLYSIPAGFWHGKDSDYCAEWLQARMRIPASEYAKLAAQFAPKAYNPDEWCRLFSDAGMKYAVFTAKHHEGFAMFKTAYSPFNIVDATPYGRDALAEFAASCRKYNLKLGIYYSHDLDWHEPDGGDPGAASEKNVGGVSWGNDWDFPDCKQKSFTRYFEGKVLPQVRELLTNYGDVSLMWFDCPNSITAADSKRLRDLVLQLQPQCLISGRIGNGYSDFDSLGDNQLPNAASKALFECPATLNDTWGYKQNDNNWKSAHEVIGQLLELTGKHCNYLLNFGPNADGELPEPSKQILRAIAQWWRVNGDAFTHTDGNPFHQQLDGMRALTKNGQLDIFLETPRSTLEICGMQSRITAANVPFEQSGETLRLDTSKLTLSDQGQASVIWPRITLEFAGALQLSQIPAPVNGLLTLTVDDAADWNNLDMPIVWQVCISQPGKYIFSCVSENTMHSREWCGERTVALCVNDTTLQAQLHADTPITGRYYQRSSSVLGTIDIQQVGITRISLRTLKITSPKAAKMQLISLQIRLANE